MNPETRPTLHSPSRLERWAAELAGSVSPETSIHCLEPLSRRTTMRVGGPADLLVEPGSESDLATVVRFCGQKDLPFLVLGRGSNLLVKDAGYRGVVISLSRPFFCGVEVESDRVRCGAGARVSAVARLAKRAGLAGFEFLEGIPGTVGGALRMNAGAMGGCIFGVLRTVRVLNRAGEVKTYDRAELPVSYRNCPALRENIALGAVLQGTPAASEEIEKRMTEFSQKRWKSQPAAASAGCIFKNPDGIPAGKLIDELGLKGKRLGGALISVEHGNFIVNEGGATAGDILELIEQVRERARSCRGIELETEVQIVGD